MKYTLYHNGQIHFVETTHKKIKYQLRLYSNKIDYLNVAIISYKLTMWNTCPFAFSPYICVVISNGHRHPGQLKKKEQIQPGTLICEYHEAT